MPSPPLLSAVRPVAVEREPERRECPTGDGEGSDQQRHALLRHMTARKDDERIDVTSWGRNDRASVETRQHGVRAGEPLVQKVALGQLRDAERAMTQS